MKIRHDLLLEANKKNGKNGRKEIKQIHKDTPQTKRLKVFGMNPSNKKGNISNTPFPHPIPKSKNYGPMW
jgi:hypothetical protein